MLRTGDGFVVVCRTGCLSEQSSLRCHFIPSDIVCLLSFRIITLKCSKRAIINEENGQLLLFGDRLSPFSPD